MLDELDETIRQLLVAEISASNGRFEVSFEQPRRDKTVSWMTPTINLFLYDVRENNILRQHQWERPLANGGGTDIAEARTILKRSPLRLDCFYMLTTWARETEDEHRLMSLCLMALFRYPELPEERLVGMLKSQPFAIQARLATHDHLTNPAEVWSALDNELRPSVSYIVTLALDPWAEVSVPVVRSLALRQGLMGSLPHSLLAGVQPSDMRWINGCLRDANKDGEPRAGVEIILKGTGLSSCTDLQGRFTLGSVPPGEYTLLAWPGKGKPVERKIVVSDEKQDYDLEL